MDELETTRVLRRREAATGQHLPIIAVTASLMMDEQQKCMQAGLDDCLTKPIKLEELEAALHKWIPLA